MALTCLNDPHRPPRIWFASRCSALPSRAYLGESALELALEPFDVAGVLPGALAQLLVGGAFADAGQGPSDGLRAVVRDARGDQRVHDVQLGRLEPDHHVGELAIGG